MKTLHDAQLEQITFLDERFYTLDNLTFYPSVTTIFDVYPKGGGFTEWLKQVGFNATEIVKRAGEQGNNVHNAIEQFLAGLELKWIGETGENYTLIEWRMILKFHEFFTEFKPKVEEFELSDVSLEFGFGGTLDMVCMLNGDRWLIDYKSSNAIHKSHELQLAAYAMMWNQKNPDKPIDRTGILWLKALTRGADKSGKKIQGHGWQLKEFDRPYMEAFKMFEHVHAIWKEENPNAAPKNHTLPDRIKMKTK